MVDPSSALRPLFSFKAPVLLALPVIDHEGDEVYPICDICSGDIGNRSSTPSHFNLRVTLIICNSFYQCDEPHGDDDHGDARTFDICLHCFAATRNSALSLVNPNPDLRHEPDSNPNLIFSCNPSPNSNPTLALALVLDTFKPLPSNPFPIPFLSPALLIITFFLFLLLPFPSLPFYTFTLSLSLRVMCRSHPWSELPHTL